MALDDIIKIHIWQLKEKTDDINKYSDYAILYDGITLRKVKLSKLYEYFNQDYKIDNIVKYFESLLREYDDSMDIKYNELKISLDKYLKWVTELESKFKINDEDIRRLTKMSNELDKNISNIDTSFTDNISIDCSDLERVFSKIQEELLNKENIILLNSKDITNLDKLISNIIEDVSQLYINDGNMKDQIEDIRNNVNTDVDNKKEELSNLINSEYDKILAIIDHYHHIHDIPYRKR